MPMPGGPGGRRREALPVFVEPMLAAAGRPDPAPEGTWAVEVKFDGIRAQLRVDGDRWCVRSRPGRDCSAAFPELAAVASALAGHRVILDGELVHFGADGRPDFAAIRRRLTSSPPAVGRHAIAEPARLVAFDGLSRDCSRSSSWIISPNLL